MNGAGSVYLWNTQTAEKLGGLVQGNTTNNIQRNVKWDFHVNLDYHKRRVREIRS